MVWIARIDIGGKQYTLGRFATSTEAAASYNEIEKILIESGATAAAAAVAEMKAPAAAARVQKKKQTILQELSGMQFPVVDGMTVLADKSLEIAQHYVWFRSILFCKRKSHSVAEDIKNFEKWNKL